MNPAAATVPRPSTAPRSDRPALILTSVLGISLVYYFIGSPRFFERYLGDFAGGGGFGLFAPSLYHFAVTMVLFFLVPAAIVKYRFREDLSAYGWQLGDRRAGLLALSWGIPLVLLLAWLASRSPEFRLQYPLFISGLESFPLRGGNITVFVLYQFTYIFYYIGWEFFFRGYALFGLRDELGVTRALLFQAAVSAALHVGKPVPELLAALPGGIVFGLVALRCRSLGAVIIAHWLLGFFLDFFILVQPS